MKCPKDIPLNEDFHPNTSEEKKQAIGNVCGGDQNMYELTCLMNTVAIATRALDHLSKNDYPSKKVKELCKRVLEGIEENSEFIRSCS
jgi:hypothetical protein